MPRLKPRDRSERLGRLLWTETAVRIPAAEYARQTGKPARTVRNHKEKPDSMSALDLIAYANISGMTNEQWIKIRGV